MSGPKWRVTVSDGRRGGNVYGFDPTDPPDDVVERVARAIWDYGDDLASVGATWRLTDPRYESMARAALRALCRAREVSL